MFLKEIETSVVPTKSGRDRDFQITKMNYVHKRTTHYNKVFIKRKRVDMINEVTLFKYRIPKKKETERPVSSRGTTDISSQTYRI